MKLEENIRLLRQNIENKELQKYISKIADEYFNLKYIYGTLTKALRNGDTTFIVRKDYVKIASKYFNEYEGTVNMQSLDTRYVFKITEQGLIKLDADFRKLEEEYEEAKPRN